MLTELPLCFVLSSVAAAQPPQAQEGASLHQPLRRTDRERAGREGSLLPRLQPAAARRPGGKWRPVDTTGRIAMSKKPQNPESCPYTPCPPEGLYHWTAETELKGRWAEWAGAAAHFICFYSLTQSIISQNPFKLLPHASFYQLDLEWLKCLPRGKTAHKYALSCFVNCTTVDSVLHLFKCLSCL